MSTIAESHLSNKDLAPTGPEQRTWGTYRGGSGGRYWFSNGYNWRALAAVAIGVVPVLPGFLNAATTEGGIIADPNFFDELYKYGVFVAFGLSAISYVALMRAAPSPARSPAPAVE